MTIQLTTQQIDAAMPKVAKGLEQYLWLQAKVTGSESFQHDAEFRKRYNCFYRVRRAVAWQNAFYGLMASAKGKHLLFHDVLDSLRRATTRYEASFASKLFATLNPSTPVIDSVVLKNLGLRLPKRSAPDRAVQISKLHLKLSSLFAAFLKTENGKYLVSNFKRIYPNAMVTDEKKLDLVLWQTRA